MCKVGISVEIEKKESHVRPLYFTTDVCLMYFQMRVAKELIELRNKSVFAFFMFNALFVLVVFLLQLNKDQIHVKWPLGVRTNITYNEETSEVFTGLFKCLLFGFWILICVLVWDFIGFTINFLFLSKTMINHFQ